MAVLGCSVQKPGNSADELYDVRAWLQEMYATAKKLDHRIAIFVAQLVAQMGNYLVESWRLNPAVWWPERDDESVMQPRLLACKRSAVSPFLSTARAPAISRAELLDERLRISLRS